MRMRWCLKTRCSLAVHHRCSSFNFSTHTTQQLQKSTIIAPVQPQSHRSVLVLDRSFDYLSWVRTTNHFKYGDIHHPSSRHVISSYSNYIYQHNSYHFNSMGEQSSFLNIAPGQRLDDDDAYAANTMVATTQIPIETVVDPKSHSLLMWPDRLLISNIQQRDVPSMSTLLLKQATISAQTIESLAAASQLSDSIRVESLAPSHAELIVIIHVSRTLSFDRSLQIKQWFDECFTAAASAVDHHHHHHHHHLMNPHHNPQRRAVSFFLTNVVKPDKSISSASVTVLPVERSYFDVISRRAVQLIVDDAIEGLLRTAPS